MLVATAPTDMNLLQVRDLDNQLFYSSRRVTGAESQHTFSREDVVKAGVWLVIQPEPYDSLQQNVVDQEKPPSRKRAHLKRRSQLRRCLLQGAWRLPASWRLRQT